MSRTCRVPSARMRRTKAQDILPSPHDHLYTGHRPVEDRLITTFMLAGEELLKHLGGAGHKPQQAAHARPMDMQSPASFEYSGWLLEVADLVARRLSEDPARGEMLEEMLRELGDGAELRMLFQRRIADMPQPHAQDMQGKPVLTRREVDVLRCAAEDLSHEEIGARLGIAVETVHTHFRRIYKKLGVQRPMQAVARAVAMRFLPIEAVDLIRLAARCSLGNFSAFGTWVNHGPGRWNDRDRGRLRQIAAAGLALFLVTHAAAQVTEIERGIRQRMGNSPATLCCLSGAGEIVWSRSYPKLYSFQSVAIAPTDSARHGFSSGHLYAMAPTERPIGLNEGIIVEVDQNGRYVRQYHGALELGRRLTADSSLAFAADGRLLATTGFLTDGLLGFTDGGATVQRIAEGCFNQVCQDPSGRTYGVQNSGVGSVVKVLDPLGRLERTFASSTASETWYGGIAVDPVGRVFVSRCQGEAHSGAPSSVDVYDSSGGLTATLTDSALEGGRLWAGEDGQIYTASQRRGQIVVMDASGRICRRMDVPGLLRPYSGCVGSDGLLYVCGAQT